MASFDVIKPIEDEYANLCEICYSNNINTDISCATCKKSTCINCCNANKSRDCNYTPIDKNNASTTPNIYNNEMNILFSCPYCRGCNIKNITEFKDTNTILKAFDRNCNNYIKNKCNSNVKNDVKNLYDILNTITTNFNEDDIFFMKEMIRHGKNGFRSNMKYTEYLQSEYHEGAEDLWASLKEHERMCVVQEYETLRKKDNEKKKYIVDLTKENIELIRQNNELQEQLKTANDKQATNEYNLLKDEKIKNKNLTQSHNNIVSKYNILASQFQIISKGTNEIFENIIDAINKNQRTSKKKTIKIIKDYLNNTMTYTFNISKV
jgi:hypothetical protein